MSTTIEITFSAQNLDKKDWWGLGNSDPYLIIKERVPNSSEYKHLHETEFIESNSDPEWEPFSLTIESHSSDLLFEVWDMDRFSKDDFIGSFNTNLEQLTRGKNQTIAYQCINSKKKKNKTYKNSGLVILNKIVFSINKIGRLSIPSAFGGFTANSSPSTIPQLRGPRGQRLSTSNMIIIDPPTIDDLDTSRYQKSYPEATIIPAVRYEDADKHFLSFGKSDNMMEVLKEFKSVCKTASISPGSFNEFFAKLKSEFMPKVPFKYNELLVALETKAKNKEYMRNKAAEGKRVLIIGGGPAGLRMAIETQLLGATTVLLEKRTSINRNNVVKLWKFVMEDLKLLGAKKLYPELGNGSVNHVSIRILQLILLKICLLLGTEVRSQSTYSRIIEPGKGHGWRVVTTKEAGGTVEEEFDVIIGATGRTGLLQGFQRKNLDTKLAIAITANFVNQKSKEERSVEEITGLSSLYHQDFFKSMNTEEGIDLENIVYFKDLTHYFVMTPTKETLLKHKVIISDKSDRESLLKPDNIDRKALERFAVKGAKISTKLKSIELPTSSFAQWKGKNDVSIFDFTNLYASSNACHIKERRGHILFQAIVGDSLVQPFWPEGTGIGKAFLSVLDTAWTIKNLSQAKMTPIQLINEREMLYSHLKHTGDTDLKDGNGYKDFSINPSTRYSSTNNVTMQDQEERIASLYDKDEK